MSSRSLEALQGQVLRLRGVVDRFGSFQQQERLQPTLCVRSLEIANTGEAITPDHWWFRLRQSWCEAGVQPGDSVIFTAKVRYCSKGWHEPQRANHADARARERVAGFAGEVRDLVVQRRGRAPVLQVQELEAQLNCQQQLREQAEADAQLLAQHRDALLEEMERLQRQVSTWKARCQILDPALTHVDRTRSPRGARHCRGFQKVTPALALRR
jgi:hypothetical protein